jgi:hypothetical protein
MPPRKSDSSKVATGDEGSVAGVGAGASTGPSTSAKKEDGVNIEVMVSLHTLGAAHTDKFDRISTSRSPSSPDLQKAYSHPTRRSRVTPC